MTKGKPEKRKSLVRFAVVNNKGEIYETGLRKSAAKGYAKIYNRIMKGTGMKVRVVPITMYIAGFMIPDREPAILPESARQAVFSGSARKEAAQ